MTWKNLNISRNTSSGKPPRRQTYRTPDEVLFGLAYTTLMLNTDMHNKQVSKLWRHKKSNRKGSTMFKYICHVQRCFVGGRDVNWLANLASE